MPIVRRPTSPHRAPSGAIADVEVEGAPTARTTGGYNRPHTKATVPRAIVDCADEVADTMPETLEEAKANPGVDPFDPTAPLPEGSTNKGGRIRTWNDQREVMLYMKLAGYRTIDISKATGLTPAYTSAVLNSPLFQARMRHVRTKLVERGHTDFLERIQQEAIPNFEFLVHMRDNPDYYGDDPVASPRIRVAAAKAVAGEVDRVYPKIQKREEERTVRVVVDADVLHRMAAAMAEAEGRDVPPIDVTPLAGPDDPVPVGAIPAAIDDMIRDMELADESSSTDDRVS